MRAGPPASPRLPELIQDVDSSLLEDSNVLTFAGLQVVQSPDNTFAAGATVPVFFKLRNLPAAAETAKLEARVQLLSQEAHSSELRVPLEKFIFPTSGGLAVVGMNLPFEKPAPGKYRVAITVTGESVKEPVSLETDLEIR